MAIKTATKQIITSKVAYGNEGDPAETKLKMGPSGDMMFAVSFFGQSHFIMSNVFDVQLQ